MSPSADQPLSGDPPDRRPGRWCDIALALALLAAVVIVVQKSAGFIGIAPFLNVDDSIPNVAVTLAERGRYGFLAAPTQGLYEVDRTHAFFNYGPLYFYVAAALTWVMGPSLTVYRLLHPFGLIAIVVLAAVTLRNVSLAGAAVVAALLFDLYFVSHWPMARPDIMVAVSAAIMLAAMYVAIARHAWWAWAVAGFGAGSALTTHQIAAAMVPAAGMMWLWQACALERTREGMIRQLRGLAWLVGGGVAAGLVYLAAIDFRIRDLLSFGDANLTNFSRPFREAVVTHYQYAWSSLTPLRWWLVVMLFSAAAVLSVAAPWLPLAIRRRTLALVMPAVVASLLYQISVGFYGNYHTGYAILSQVSTLWAAGAVVSVFVWWLGARSKVFEVIALVAATALVVTADISWLTHRSLWETRAVGNVRIDDYIHEAISPLPERASVWGSLYFGVDSGDRLDLVQMLQLLPVVIEDFKPERVEELAPDYLVMSSYETDIDFVRYLAGFRTIEGLSAVFPNIHYRLAHLAYALPYGAVRVYEHQDAPVAVRPSVTVTDSLSPQWSRQLGEPLPVTFAAADPVVASVSLYSMAPRRRALASRVADLPAGFYAIEVALDRPARSHFGYVLASSGPSFYWRGGWTTFSVPAAPYFGDENHVTLVVDHLGGPLYISRFENAPQAATDAATDRTNLLAELRGRTSPHPADPGNPDRYGLQVLSVRPVALPRHDADRLLPITVPEWKQWSAQTSGVDATVRGDGRVVLKGSAAPFAYVFESPWIDVPRRTLVGLTVPTETTMGSIEVGVLGSDGNWITSPTMMPRRLAFNSGEFTRVRIVFANGGLGREVPFDVAAALPQLTPVAPNELYVDRLMACRSPYIPRSPDCAR